MRSRYKEDDSRSEEILQTQVNDWNGNVTNSQSTSLCGELASVSTQDVVTPNWKAKIAAGEIINNPFISVTTSVDTGKYYFNKIVKDEPSGRSYTLMHLGVKSLQSHLFYLDEALPPVPTCTPPVDQAVTQAFANISNSEAMMLVTLAESKKTVVSLTQILMRAVRIFKQVKRLEWHSLRNEISSKQLSDRYLELRYAIRPLMYDAKSLIAAYTSAAKARRQTFRGFSTDPLARTDIFVQDTVYNSWFKGDVTTSISGYTEVESTVYSGVLTSIDHISRADVYGYYDVPESILELVPWSFIINWFVNLADTVASWTPEAGVKVLTSWATEKSVARRVINRVDVNYVITNQNIKIVDDSYVLSPYTHTVVTTRRIPNPQRKIIPRFKVNLDILKLLDLILILKKLR